MNSKLLFGLALLLTFLFYHPADAQQTATYDQPSASYKLALNLYHQQQFGAAEKAFDRVSASPTATHLEKVNASYYAAACALELEHEDGTYKMTRFIRENPEHTLVKRAYFQMGRHQFGNKKYSRALESFKNVKVTNLSRQERIEYYFKKGISQYKTKNNSRAKSSLSRVINTSSEYAGQAMYYYAVIAFEEGNDDLAAEYFTKVKDERRFSKSVSNYLAMIYHRKGEYSKMLELAVPAYQTASGKEKPGLALMIGDAYYQQERYEEAVPYFEFYERFGRRSMSREDAYEIGYTYLMQDNYKAAIQNFQRATGEDDELAQNAYYHLAFCYLQTDQKKFASKAFSSAYQIDIDKEISEDALFNYAKLTMEIANDPYNTAIKALEDYIEKYPGSERVDEAYSFLAELYLNTNNYKQALVSVEKIRSRSAELKEAYQKICFYRGIELFNENRLNDAVELLKIASVEDFDRTIAAEALFWIGEAFYRQDNSWGAIKYYKDFLDAREAKKLDAYSTAYYNLGYAYFNKKDYNSAIRWFGDFVDYRGSRDESLVTDAQTRLGDCYFIRKDYDRAIRYYAAAGKSGGSRADYALYQKAITQGASGNLNAKSTTLRTLVDNHKGSTFADDAKYELAVTYLLLNRNSDALSWFNRVISDHPNSRFVVKALLKTGLIHYNENRNEKALQALKTVVNKYPATPEAREALNSIRNIYIDQNRVDEYYAFAEGLSFADVSVSEQDSITYIAAENLYMENNCEKALTAFASYLDGFPQGTFSINASYYKAQCELRNNNREAALSDLEFVISKPASGFTTNSLLQAARISKETEQWRKALEYYSRLSREADSKDHKLEALEGMTESNYALDKHAETITSAMLMLSNENVDDDQINKAHFLMAKSYMAMENIENARMEFSITEKLSNSILAAESKYMMAYIDYITEHLNEAENGIFELSDKYGSYDFWVAKGFLLLADIYIARGNIFQAKETLKSIIENYDGPQLGEIAAQKLDRLEEEEKDSQEENSEQE